jgi:hypothetical protein
MDKQLSPQEFQTLLGQAYPTYFIDLNQKCFTRCVRIPIGHAKTSDSDLSLSQKLGSLLKLSTAKAEDN